MQPECHECCRRRSQARALWPSPAVSRLSSLPYPTVPRPSSCCTVSEFPAVPALAVPCCRCPVCLAKHILKEGNLRELQDLNLVDACEYDEFEKMVLAATLCIKAKPQPRPDISLLAGFELEVVKITSAAHARKLAASVDFSACPDGIICVGGDGIINEVLKLLQGDAEVIEWARSET